MIPLAANTIESDPHESQQENIDWQIDQCFPGIERTSEYVRVRHCGDQFNVTGGNVMILNGSRCVVTIFQCTAYLWDETEAKNLGWIE